MGMVLYPVYKDEKLYNMSDNYGDLNRWSSTQAYISKKGGYPFLYSATRYKKVTLEGYDREEVEKIFSGYSDSDIPSKRKVNIISIMREEYVDFSQNDIKGFDKYRFYEDTYGALAVNYYPEDELFYSQIY